MSRLRSEERGMTLVELLAAMAIAVIVSFAAFSLIEAVMKRTGEVGSRVETTQRARQAMDNITRDLRSQVCVLRSDGTPDMTTARTVFSASANSITFFGDTADESWKPGTVAMPVATLRTIALTGGTVDPVSGLLVGATINETTRPGANDPLTAGAITFASATGQTTRTELSEAVPVKDSTGKVLPIFTYYAYDNSTPPQAKAVLDPGTGNLSDDDVSRIARIGVTFRVLAANKRTLRGSTVIQDDITVRTVDQNSANPEPTCI
jgi:prepilin-type N-terminal cleavage/methylation domain-containing protein